MHVSELPTPEVENPGEHEQVVAPAPLTLPVGQAVHEVAPVVLLYVPAVQPVQVKRGEKTRRAGKLQKRSTPAYAWVLMSTD